MNKYIKFIALVLSLVMLTGIFFGCNKKAENCIGTVNGEKIPDGVFINNFFDILDKESTSENWSEDYNELYGNKLYEALVAKKMDGKTYFDTIVDKTVEDSRIFMIKHLVFSTKAEWPDEEKRKELKENAISYIDQMNTYYGPSFGVKTVEEFVKVAYSMSYDQLVDYFVMSGCIETYKQKLEEGVMPTDEELLKYYEDNFSKFKTVQVRHSLLELPDNADDKAKEELRAEAQTLVDKYNAGEITFDNIMERSDDVDAEGKPNSDGYYVVYDGTDYVKAFEEWGLKQTAASDKIEIVETEYGYHIMMCTKILDTSDDEVHDRVYTAYMDEKVNSKVEEEIASYKKDKNYKIKDYNREYAYELAKKVILGDAEAAASADATATASGATADANATPTPTVSDAAADTTVVAKYKGAPIYKAYYTQFFSQAMNSSFAEYDFTELNKLESEKEYFEALKKVFYEEYKDGKNYLDYSKDEALDLMLKFFAAKEMAIAAEKGYSKEKTDKLLGELDTQIDSLLSYSGEQYGVKTRDELLKKIMNMNVNDYKTVYVDQMMVNDYATSIIEEIKPEESVLFSHYQKDPDKYRIVTIRIITKSILDADKKEVSEKEQNDVLNFLKILEEKIKNGDSAEALAIGYSDDTDSANGLMDLTKAKSALVGEKIADWAFKQTEVGATTIIKTDSAYKLVVIEGLTDYNGTKGITTSSDITHKVVQDQVQTEYKNYAYEDQVEKYVKDNSLALSDIDQTVIQQVIEEYINYNSVEDKEDKKETE